MSLYSWSLIRLVMVKLALHNVKSFLPLTGLDFIGALAVKYHTNPYKLKLAEDGSNKLFAVYPFVLF